MSNDTHLNAFKQDAKDALAKAHAALSDAELAVDELVNKVQAETITNPAGNTVVPPNTVADNQTTQDNSQQTTVPPKNTPDPSSTEDTSQEKTSNVK